MINFVNAKVYNLKLEQNNMSFGVDNGVIVNSIAGDNISNAIVLPKFNYLNFNSNNYNIFNLDNLSEESLEKQLNEFDKTKLTFMFLTQVYLLDQEYEIIVPFCKKHNIKIVAKAGASLYEMGECDKLNGCSPVDYLESVGVLNLEPIILSGANLEKQDIEKLSYYNASVCLDVSSDWLLGNGIALIPQLIKYNISVTFNACNILTELYTTYVIAKGYYKLDNINLEYNLLNWALNGFSNILGTIQTDIKVGNKADFMVFINVNNLEELLLNIVTNVLEF